MPSENIGQGADAVFGINNAVGRNQMFSDGVSYFAESFPNAAHVAVGKKNAV